MKTLNATSSLYGRFLTAIGLMLMTVITVRADYQSTVLNDHPLAYYPINSSVDPTGATATDLSGNGNNGTYNGTDPQFNTVPGPTPFLPNALQFDGFTSFVDLSTGSNPGLLNFNGTITMEAWAQPANSTQGPADILGKGYDGTFEITLRANGGNYYGGFYNGNTFAASGGVQNTNWAYLVSTYDGTNWNLYVNGALVQANRASTGSVSFATPWAIGNGTPTSSNTRFFLGNLCQVAFYTNALTPSQVLNHYYSAVLNASPATSVPIISTQPQSQASYIGGSVTFSVTAVSAFPETNQWFKGSTPLTGQTNSTLVLTNLQPGSAGNYSVVVGNANGTTNSASVSLTVSPPNNLQWSANGNNGTWDTQNSANWINLANSQQVVFNPGDKVLFDDTVGVPTTVNVNGTVIPSLITVNSSANSFTLTGGSISGSGGLLKEGSSLLTDYSSGALTGPAIIGGGTIYAGNNSFNSVSSVTVSNGATFDLAGGTLNNSKPVIVSGSGQNGVGAIYNSYNDDPSESMAVTLAGDATFGGSQRWDFVTGSISGPHKVTVNWSTTNGYGEWNTVTIAPNVGDIEVATGALGIKSMGATFGNPASNFIVDAGMTLDFWTGDSGYAKNFHGLSGSAIQFVAGFQTLAGNLTLEDSSKFTAYGGSGTNVVDGTIVLNGTTHFVLGDADFVFTNVLSGPGGFVWDAYNHELFLQSANTYTGPTVIGGGLTLGLNGNGSISHSSLIFLGGATIDVSGRSDNTLALTSGQTLAGVGTISGTLIVPSGATISPSGTNVTLGLTEGSSSTGTITASNGVSLSGTTLLKLNGSGVNDQIISGAAINYGGTLTVANISGAPLAVGNSFQLFSATSYNGSFSAISPATPGAGLAWDTSQLNSGGFLNVIASGGQGPLITSTTVTGGNLIFSGTGGSPGANYVVFTTTNLVPANWTPLVTNSFNGTGGFSVTNAISTGIPHLFYRIN